jgi:hypothetical protein
VISSDACWLQTKGDRVCSDEWLITKCKEAMNILFNSESGVDTLTVDQLLKVLSLVLLPLSPTPLQEGNFRLLSEIALTPFAASNTSKDSIVLAFHLYQVLMTSIHFDLQSIRKRCAFLLGNIIHINNGICFERGPILTSYSSQWGYTYPLCLSVPKHFKPGWGKNLGNLKLNDDELWLLSNFAMPVVQMPNPKLSAPLPAEILTDVVIFALDVTNSAWRNQLEQWTTTVLKPNQYSMDVRRLGDGFVVRCGFLGRF